MGSTSYDEARDASDPRWAGASWYGPTTGEYWIVNPREYADPRKHGPGYSNRVRSGEAAPSFEPAPAPGSPEEPVVGAMPEHGPDATRAHAGEPAAARPEAGGTHRAASPERAADPERAAGTRRAAPRRGRPARATAIESEPWAEASTSSEDAGHRRSTDHVPPPHDAGPSADAPFLDALIRPGSRDPLRAVGLVLLAWAPVGIAAAAVIGQVTGCGSYSASCDGTDPYLPWVAQAIILGLLLLIPLLARVFAAGTLGLLVGLVPATGLVIALGGARSSAAPPVLGVVLVIAWLVGVGWGLRRLGSGSVGASR